MVPEPRQHARRDNYSSFQRKLESRSDSHLVANVQLDPSFRWDDGRGSARALHRNIPDLMRDTRPVDTTLVHCPGSRIKSGTYAEQSGRNHYYSSFQRKLESRSDSQLAANAQLGPSFRWDDGRGTALGLHRNALVLIRDGGPEGTALVRRPGSRIKFGTYAVLPGRNQYHSSFQRKLESRSDSRLAANVQLGPSFRWDDGRGAVPGLHRNALVVSFQQVVHSGLTEEIGVTKLQTSLEVSPNEHPQECRLDAAKSTAIG